MKSVIITQSEPFYIPVLMGKLLAEYKDVAALMILPGVPKGFNVVSYWVRLYNIFGVRDSFVYGLLLGRYLIQDFVNRFRHADNFHSLRLIAKRYSIPVYSIKKANSPSTIEVIKTLKPDIIISVAAPQVFKKDLINSATHAINIHAALLPEYRGMMPSFWVLAKGEEKTGVTVHYIDEKIDTGKILAQKQIEISSKDTLHSLQIKVANTGASALLEALYKIKENVGATTPVGQGYYYSLPTLEAAKELRKRGRRFI